jgi:hypothetical protein
VSHEYHEHVGRIMLRHTPRTTVIHTVAMSRHSTKALELKRPVLSGTHLA